MSNLKWRTSSNGVRSSSCSITSEQVVFVLNKQQKFFFLIFQQPMGYNEILMAFHCLSCNEALNMRCVYAWISYCPAICLRNEGESNLNLYIVRIDTVQLARPKKKNKTKRNENSFVLNNLRPNISKTNKKKQTRDWYIFEELKIKV